MDLEAIERSVRDILIALGRDPEEPGLRDTPLRVARAWGEMAQGYGVQPSEVLKTCFDSEAYSEMVTVEDVEFFSTCEHHLLPFSGVATVSYIPNQKVVGISKLVRLVDCFSRRLQIQERMTDQIADAIDTYLAPAGVGVSIRASHLCMACRGVKRYRSRLTTTSLRGSYRTDPACRLEFIQRIT